MKRPVKQRRHSWRSLWCERLESRRLLIATPLITEFMASNQTGLISQFDGNTHDWIEIYNPGPGAVDLKDWYLTDDKDELHIWQFPKSVVLAEDEYLVVFASGNGLLDVDTGDELHTNFRLASRGEYLALVRPDGTTLAAEYEPFYPEQTADVSYGLSDSLDEEAYFTTPTPGERNPPFFKDTVFSPGQGYYVLPIRVALDENVLEAPIYYSTDGSAPTSNSLIYEDLIPVTGTTTLRARSFGPNSDGTIYTQTYVFAQQTSQQPAAPDNWPARWTDQAGRSVVADYEFDAEIADDPRYRAAITEDLLALPTLLFSVDPVDLFDSRRGIYSNPLQRGRQWERPASVELIYPNGDEGFQADAGIRIRGGASRDPAGTPKHSFRLYFRAEYGPTVLRASLFPETPVAKFDRLDVNAGFGDSWLSPSTENRNVSVLMRDEWFRQTVGDLGQPTAHGSFVHLYLNGLYWGVYNLTERIDEAFGAIHFGGMKEDYDVIDSGALQDGEIDTWNALLSRVRAGVSRPSDLTDIRRFLDVENFIDFFIVRLYAGDLELGAGDWFALRNRTLNEPFRFFVSDAEQVLRGVNNNLLNSRNNDDVTFIFNALRGNALFRRELANRIHEHFFNDGALTTGANTQRWARLAAGVSDAIVAESARWGDYRRDVQPTRNDALYTRDDHWIPESARMLGTYFPLRSNVVKQQFREAGLYPSVEAPTFNQHGGEIQRGYSLSITAPQGEIYFTTDGSDPILLDGSVAPAAAPYDGPIVLVEDTTIRAQSVVNGQPSASSRADFFIRVPLQLSEIHFNPTPDPLGQLGSQEYAFVELFNAGQETIDLTGVRFDRGVAFSFDESEVHSIDPQQRIVIVKDEDLFAQRYGVDNLVVAGEYSGTLNQRDGIRVIGAVGQTMVEVEYDEEWFKIVEDEFFSLVLRDESNISVDLSNPDLWRPSHFVDGSPGIADSGLRPDAVVISEALTHSDESGGDWLELHNTSQQDVDIGGWWLSGSSSDLRQYQIPEKTVLAAGGHLLFTSHVGEKINEAGQLGFSISKLGEKIFLTSAGRGDELGGYRTVVTFTYGFNSSSFIRYTNSTGETEYVVATERTPGFPNVSPPAVERIRDHDNPFREAVISEIMYHPFGDGDEFIELYNPHSKPTHLDQPFMPSWRFTSGVFYNFPDDPGPVLPPRSYALIVGIEADEFRRKHNVPPDVQVFGPYLGELINTGEKLVLSRAAETAAFVPFSMNDQVHYNSPSADWPIEADGQGASLIRNSYRAYGNDVMNWAAGNIGGTPGRPNRLLEDRPRVVERVLFYNESAFDENDAAIETSDDLAIAVNKFALLPGGTATFQNYTSYDKGINGLMIDLHAPTGTPTIDDFEFRIGNDDQPAGWSLAPAPTMQVRMGAGYGDSDRMVFTWPAGSIRNQWLEVRVRSTPNTGLADDDVFYFGNAVGDTGNSLNNTFVDATDYVRVRQDVAEARLIEETDVFDFNRDGFVDSVDAKIVVSHTSNLLTALRLIQVRRDARPAAAVRARIAGDLTGDGIFDQLDLEAVAAALEYEDGIEGNSSWSEGDWNGDGDFTSADLVFALQTGTFVTSAKDPANAADLLFAGDDDALRRGPFVA